MDSPDMRGNDVNGCDLPKIEPDSLSFLIDISANY